MPTLKKTATFRFYGDLNDFLPADYRQSDVPYRFWGQPAVKDAVEAIGVPHPEVFYLQRDESAIGFGATLQADDRISAYPHMSDAPPDAGWLHPLMPAPPRFVLDGHLGQLARYLRMLGLDTRYQNDADDGPLARIADEEDRILLTRDLGLLKRGRVTYGAFVRATDPDAQIREVLQRYPLADHLDPLTRCVQCNHLIEPVPEADVADDLPPQTQRDFDRFFQCTGCAQVYWKGSHYERMQAFVADLLATTNRSKR
jgi:hypothetical protein